MSGRTFGISLLVVVGLLVCAPLVPLAFVMHSVRQRRRGVPTWPRLGFMTRAGRAVLLIVAFLGVELVAIDSFASTYFGAVDEHAAPILGDFLLFLLVAIIAADFAAKGVVAAFRFAAGSPRN